MLKSSLHSVGLDSICCQGEVWIAVRKPPPVGLESGDDAEKLPLSSAPRCFAVELNIISVQRVSGFNDLSPHAISPMAAVKL
jgi:hypothetical protein